MTFTVRVLCYVAVNVSSLGFQPQVWPMSLEPGTTQALYCLLDKWLESSERHGHSVCDVTCRLSLYLDTMLAMFGVRKPKGGDALDAIGRGTSSHHGLKGFRNEAKKTLFIDLFIFLLLELSLSGLHSKGPN